MKIVYVVLHYLATLDTIECVESIFNNVKSQKHDSEIVVVDNGSPNGSYADLEKAFENYPSVTLIRSEENLGFARGNNIGYQYAKYKKNADFIVLLNNDTIINQSNFTDIIVRKFEEKQYSVLGPDIVSAAGYHQNPGRKQSWNLKELVIFRLKKRNRLLLSYLHMDSLASKVIEQVKEIYRTETLVGDMENTILHGACLIFSPLYVKRFEGLHDKTFLYMEEDILKLYADFYGFLMLYSSELQIYHREDVATNMVEATNDKKARLKYKYLIASSKIYSRLKKNMIAKKKIINTAEKVVGRAKAGGIR
ncbi:MAG: glycosyltransferase family 2 protein [Dorea sp.]|nr:glycosyltransferase [uncultured Schaedlerella sp.]MCI9076560.1 glycosyltransferase family 2 protein [Dorea sp.]